MLLAGAGLRIATQQDEPVDADLTAVVEHQHPGTGDSGGRLRRLPWGLRRRTRLG